MKAIEAWLAEYAESHQHPLNIAIHKVAVPAITFSLLAFTWTVPLPVVQNLAIALSLLAFLFYCCLSIPLALGMLMVSTLMLALVRWVAEGHAELLPRAALLLFVVAWILQFIGHKIEGKKPSFFQDVTFLMIGPLWTLRFVYDRFKVRI